VTLEKDNLSCKPWPNRPRLKILEAKST